MNIGQEQQILVEVGALEFCIDLNEVLSIISPPKMVRLPAARGSFTRAFKYLDELGAAVSIRAKFELDERQDMQSGQLLLSRINERLAGFWFDKIVGILKVGDDLQVYEDFEGLNRPSPVLDQLFVYKQRLIPHVTLFGLLHFEQASEWKHWAEIDKPELERLLREAEQALLDEETGIKLAKELANRGQEDIPPQPMDVDELYELMDDAGVEAGAGEKELSTAEYTPDVEAARSVASVDSPDVVEEVVQGADSQAGLDPTAEPTGDAQNAHIEEPEQDTDSNTDATVTYGLMQTSTTEEPEARDNGNVNELQEDALFSLERKNEALRQRMDSEQEVDLSEYQIIKVGDKGLLKGLRRWLRRLVLISLLMVLAAVSMVGVEYVNLHGNPIDRIVIQAENGEVDWARSYAEGTSELKRFSLYVKEFVQAQLQRLE